MNRRRITRLNARYRGINSVTDVLSFPMFDTRPPENCAVLGDIVICIPEALKDAQDSGEKFYDYLLRLLVHGLLHLLGYDHERDALHERKMTKKERELANAIKEMA